MHSDVPKIDDKNETSPMKQTVKEKEARASFARKHHTLEHCMYSMRMIMMEKAVNLYIYLYVWEGSALSVWASTGNTECATHRYTDHQY